VFLDEQPGRLAAVVPAAMHAHQRPAALEFVSVQGELQLALAQPLDGIVHGFPPALVPDDHPAGTVLALGNLALERVVRQGMVFDL